MPFGTALIVLLLFFNASNAHSQHLPQQRPVSPSRRVAATQTELERRLEVRRKALDSGNPEEIKTANQRVITIALTELAGLRMAEAAYMQATELYHRSVLLEDTPDAHVHLALAYLQAGKPSDAIEEAEKTLFSAPKNARAWRIEGTAWMVLRDYRRAADALAKSVAIEPDFEAAYSLAICYLTLHDKDHANAVFAEQLKKRGESGAIHVLFGRAYRDAEYTQDAIRELKRALIVDPHTQHAHYFLGLLALVANEWSPTSVVREELRQELRINPRDFLANYLLGVFASGDKQFAESDRYLNAAASVSPDWPDPWLYLGLNAYGKQDNVTAEALFRKAIQLTGADESRNHYQIRRAYFALGRILYASDRREEAAKLLQKARDFERVTLGESQQLVASMAVPKSAAQGMGAVMPLLDKAEEEQAASDMGFADPTSPLTASEFKRSNFTDVEKHAALEQERYLRKVLGSSFNDLGTVAARRQQFSPALSHFQEAERWDPDIPGLVRNLGIAAMRVKDYPEASRALGVQVVADPNDVVSRSLLGMALYENHSYAEAVKVIAPLGEKAFQEPSLSYAWAASLMKSGNIDEGRRVLQRVEEQARSNDTLFLVGQNWMEIGEYLRAATVFRKISDHDPGFPQAHYKAGISFIRADRPSEAAAEFQAELALTPDDPDAKYSLAYAYILESRKDLAVPLLQQVIAARPDHGDAQYQLGKVLLDEENVKDAIGHLETASRLQPDKDYVHYQLQAAYRKDARVLDADRELQLYKEVKARNRQKSVPQSEQRP